MKGLQKVYVIATCKTRFGVAFGLLVIILVWLSSSLAFPAPERPFAPCLTDFLATVYAPPDQFDADLGNGMIRLSFESYWSVVEPKKGEWHFEAMDKVVLALNERGFQVVPMLGFTVGWASSAADGNGNAPPREVADWENYVETMVARYSRPPFNVKYFQLWNEPKWSLDTGFWTGTGPEWVDMIFIPGARIIRKYGCKTVFGGWPCNQPQDLDTALEYNDCWRWVDIIDVHYFPVDIFQEIWDKYLANGHCEGLWQTEIGWLTFPNYLPNCYLRALYWALGHGWSEDANRYKLFWFACWGAGPDGQGSLTQPGEGGNVLSQHGLRQKVLNEVLGSATLARYDDYTTSLNLQAELTEENPTVLGFQVGEARRVVVLLITPDLLKANASVVVKCSGLPSEPASVRLLEVLGNPVTVQSSWEEGILTCTFQTDQLKAETARNYGVDFPIAPAYLVVDLANTEP